MTVARARTATAIFVAALLSVGALIAPSPAQADTPEGLTFDEYMGIEDGKAGQLGEIDTEAATKIINGLDVAERDAERDKDYDRIGQFGDWASQASGNSADEDFCGDTRNDILNRDLSDVEYKDDDDCLVVSGKIHDPYTGAKFDFERGVGTSTRVQIEHIFALKAGWVLGADKLSKDERVELANDPENLIAVYGPANGSKGDQGPGTWTPADYEPSDSDEFMPDLIDYDDAYECQYAAHYAWVAGKYDLSVTAEDKDAMVEAINDCKIAADEPTEDPTTPAPTPTEDPTETPTEEPTDEPTDDPTLGPVPDEDANSDADGDKSDAKADDKADGDNDAKGDDGAKADDAKGKADGGDSAEGGDKADGADGKNDDNDAKGGDDGAKGDDSKGKADGKNADDDAKADDAADADETPADEGKADGADAGDEEPSEGTAADEDPAPTGSGDEDVDVKRELTVNPRQITTERFLDKGVAITSTGHKPGDDVTIKVSHRDDSVDPATFEHVAGDSGEVKQGVHAIAHAVPGVYDVVVSDAQGDMTSSFTVTDTAAKAGGDSPSDDGSDSSPLPRTGASLTGIIAGVVLAVVGAVAVVLARARRKQD